MFKAGTAIIDISPDKGEELAGYPHYPRNNTGVHDPLMASCLYLSDGKTELAMVTLDMLFFSKQHVKAVREKVAARCGIPGAHIMISCSHTHSGPWAAGRLDLEGIASGVKQPEAYVSGLVEKIASIIVKAKKEAFDASFGANTAMCGAESGVGGNRRIPGGPHDPLVSVMAVKDAAGTVRGVFVNYTLHPSFIHEWSTVVTADYPCYLKRQVNDEYPGAVVGFSQGASGNQSSRYYRKGESFDEAERVGRTLGKAAVEAVGKAEYRSDITLSAVTSEMPLETRDFADEETLVKQVAEDKARYEELYAKYGKSTNRDEYYLWQNANLKCLGSEDQLGYVRMKKNHIKIELLEDEQPVELQIFRIGDLCVVGVPGEVFVEYALYIKAMAGYPMVIFNELTGGCLPGYLYTPESLRTGGYETDTSMLGTGFGRHLVDKVLDTIAACPAK